jgi:hypothetical protein
MMTSDPAALCRPSAFRREASSLSQAHFAVGRYSECIAQRSGFPLGPLSKARLLPLRPFRRFDQSCDYTITGTAYGF